ncbi:MAG: hypothetical protein B0W54_06035 [Cellvibrio sp. 79]|nr:MAG: hypothetical protein B0W54_06035 [Cellvibrio sp. 79]
MSLYNKIFQHLPIKELPNIPMSSITNLLCIHLAHMLNPTNMQKHTDWAYECMLNGSENIDVVLLASSIETEERLSLTLSLLKCTNAYSLFYPDSKQLIDKLERIFPNNPPPTKVTIYKNNDPRDYDGEGALVESALQGKYWKEMPEVKPWGFFMTYLTHEALVYYLPGFFIYALIDTPKYSDIDQRLIWLFFNNDLQRQNDLIETSKLLTQEQINCFISCALFLLTHSK